MKNILMALVVSLAVTGCQHQSSGGSQVQDKNLTVGAVQAQIKKGLPSSSVIEALGSPNIISTDAEGREVWVYDKFSSESHSSGLSTGLIPSLFVKGSSNSSGKSQTTMTVIIKFDEAYLVRDVAYHRSKF